MVYELVDQAGNVIGTIETEGDVSNIPGYEMITAADTDTSFTVEWGDQTYSGIRVRTKKSNGGL